MKYSWIKYYTISAFLIVLSGCAQINPLEGGAKDTYAPRIDTSGTSPLSGDTNFKGSEVQIKFSEYISLNNPSENIIITPQLNETPEITAKNKKLIIRFNELLSENTTYTISFNHAVRDITEKNDSVFQFVFSTGNYIDSLKFEGVVLDAFTNSKMEGVLVGLYPVDSENQYGSIPYNQRPLYFAQTGRNGRFKLNYLKEGLYYAFAFEDGNRNLKLDPSEKRAFGLEETVKIDLETKVIRLYAYKPLVSETKLITTKFLYPGKVELIFSNPPGPFNITTSQKLFNEDTGSDDSLVYWLEKNPDSKMRFRVDLNGEIDTLKPLYKGSPLGKKRTAITATTNLISGALIPKTKFKITYSEPILDYDKTKIHLFDIDSVELLPTPITIENVRTLVFDSLPANISWVSIDSSAVNSRYQHSTMKDEWWSVKLLEANYFGSLILNIDTVFNVPVLVELLNDKNELIQTTIFKPTMVFKELIPGNYQVRLIFDANNDGEWTGGSLIERRQPEKVIYNKELIGIKSKWEKEVDWLIEN